MKIKLANLRTQVEKKKIGSVKKAYKSMEEILPAKEKTEFIND